MAPPTPAANKPSGPAPANSGDSAKPGRSKAAQAGKKVIVRRLPPGMIEEEFWSVLGDEWKEGNGKVDWFQYHTGFISSDPMDPSQPARGVLHLMNVDDIAPLSLHVQNSAWEDAKNSYNDPVLISPPCLELAPFQKIPTAKKRIDPRQGTIDQEPEFQAFLQSLTEAPGTASKGIDPDQAAEDSPKAESKVTTTALVQYLKDKKANKTKETTNAKGSSKHARHESSSGKSKDESKKKSKESKSEKAEKAAGEKEKEKPKEPVKLLTKKAATQEPAESSKSTAQNGASKPAEEATPKSRRANIAAAAKILQRDLGLSPGSAHRRARQDAAKAEAATKSDPPKESKDTKEKEKEPKDSAPSTPVAEKATPVAQTSNGPKSQGEGSRRSRNKGGNKGGSGEAGKGKGAEKLSGNSNTKASVPATPVILKRDDNTGSGSTNTPASAEPAANTSTPAPPAGPKSGGGNKAPKTDKSAAASQKKGSAQPPVTAGATRAFVKHANASQGVTEAALKQCLEAFGAVSLIEMDKRKGFAYVEFGGHEALAKAIAASPVTVGSGTVQILERKETKKPNAPSAQATSDKPSADKAGEDKTGAEKQSDRPTKRGGRGRGRRGGGGGEKSGAAKDAAANGEQSTAPESAKSASKGDSTSKGDSASKTGSNATPAG